MSLEWHVRLIHTKEALKCVLLLAAIFAAVELGLLFLNVSRETVALVQGSNELIRMTDKRLEGTFQNVNAVLVQAGLIASRAEDLSRSWDIVALKQGIYWDKLQGKTIVSLDKFDAATDQLAGFLKNTDESLNEHLFPEIAATAKKLGISAGQLTILLKILSHRTALTFDELDEILKDPMWQATLAEVQGSAKHLDEVTGNLSKASDSWPEITDSVNQIAATSSRYRKLILLSQVVSALARAFF